MRGAICLQGGAEFTPGCEAMDRALLEHVQGPVVVLALAAAPGRDYAAAHGNGVRWFRDLGAEVLELGDPRDHAQAARRPIERAGLVVLPGGSPNRLLKGLRATGLDELLSGRVADGCAVLGASAGAMVLCETLLLPDRGLALADGLGLAPGLLVIPHWSGSRPDWEEAALPSGMQVLGIPEESGVLLTEEGIRAVGQHPTRLVLERQDLTPGVSSGMLGAGAQGGMTVVTEVSGAAPVTDRMQALLSRAVEEQVSEQRAVSTVLAELRAQVETLEAGVRGAAANTTVAALETAVSTVVADQRTATTLLSQRLEALTQRMEALTALGEQVDGQARALDSVRAELANLAAFPTALAALQRDVAGLHDRLAPLGEVRAAVADLGARAGGAESLAPQLEALQAKVDALGVMPDPERFRDAVVDAMTSRLERLQQAVDRPVVGPEVLKSDLGDLRASLSVALGRELETLTEAVHAVGRRVEHLEQAASARTDDTEQAAVTGELARIQARFDDVTALRGQVERLATEIAALRSDQAGDGVPGALAALADGLERLSERAAAPSGPSSDELSLVVSQRVADRLVETLAPRIADVVLTRVSAALVHQLGETLGSRLRADTEQVLAAHTAASEQRLTARLDEGVMALAEALLRKKPGGTRAKASVPAPVEELPPVHEVVAELDAPVEVPAPPAPEAAPEAEVAVEAPAAVTRPEPAPDPRPAVTTGMAPAPAPARREAPPAPPAEERAAAPSPEPPAAAVPEVKAPPLKPATRPRPAAKKAAPAKKAPPAKASVRKPATKAAPPAKPTPVKAERSAPRPRPAVEPTVEPDAADAAPVRPATPPPPPAAAPAAVLPPLQRQPVPPPPPARPVEPQRRKPWWRPGG